MKIDITNFLLLIITFVRAQVHEACFGGSNSVGRDNQSEENTYLEQLMAEFDSEMRLTTIKGCESALSSQIQNLQFTLTSQFDSLQLQVVGPERIDLPMNTKCTFLSLKEDEYIRKMEVGYTNS